MVLNLEGRFKIFQLLTEYSIKKKLTFDIIKNFYDWIRPKNASKHTADNYGLETNRKFEYFISIFIFETFPESYQMI